MPSKIEIKRLISGEVKPEEMMKLKEDFNEIQRSLVIEQKNNKKKAPPASGDIMRERYEGR
jgi:hypothetical protein